MPLEVDQVFYDELKLPAVRPVDEGEEIVSERNKN
jgi:hypothetical protein